MSTKLGDVTLTKQSGTMLTLNTKEKYVNDDVSFNISVIQGSVTQNAPTVDSTGLVTATVSTIGGFVSTNATADSNTLQLSTKGTETYPFTTLGGATIPAGKYLTGDQTILQAYTSGIEAGNIKYGETIKVGDTQNNGRIHNVAGTFTKADTVSSGHIAATANKILSGYSAWVDGEEVKGSVGAGTASISGTNVVTPSASISGSNVTLSNTDNGISVTSTGGGSANASVVATSGNAGYITASTQLDSETIAASNITTTASSFISGVTITAPSSGTRTFSVTVPNGSTTATFVFNVDSNGNVTITEN